jgi:choline kinase
VSIPPRAVIVAAGLGQRLRPHTDHRPKCMVDVAGKTLLDWQCEALAQVGIDSVTVVRGYRGDAIRRPGLEFADNPDYARNNILGSLLCAEKALAEGCVISYSDILYGRDVVAPLVASEADIAIVVDVAWQAAYVGRDGHPPAEAELVSVRDGRVVEAGKGLSPGAAHGEFIGLLKLSARGAAIFCEAYHRARAVHGDDGPFRRAARFERAYLTDMLEELAAAGVAVVPVDIRGGWREIDVPGDLERARAWWTGRV